MANGASEFQQKSEGTLAQAKDITISLLLLGLVILIVTSGDGDPPFSTVSR